MDLANSGFGHAERFRDFAKAHVFEIIKSQNFALHLGKLIDSFSDDAGQFFLSDAVVWTTVRHVRDPFVASRLIFVFTANERIKANESRWPNLGLKVFILTG